MKLGMLMLISHLAFPSQYYLLGEALSVFLFFPRQ